MTSIDPHLLARTKSLENQFDTAIGRLGSNSELDLRIFFTMAHGYITGKIGRHVELFTNPNALMRLNESFATAYLHALNGVAHGPWARAFSICKGESKAVTSGFVGLIFIGPVAAEVCGACMASVHINHDLRHALMKVRDVDAQDYGNILIFVEEGNLYAESQLRGQALGSAATIMGHLFANRLNLDVREWRNKVFQDCYNKSVPDPSDRFVAAYHKRERR
jgi:hypothetical protein